jgi:hypothetical protein
VGSIDAGCDNKGVYPPAALNVISLSVIVRAAVYADITLFKVIKV